MEIIISPSLLSCDLANMEKEALAVYSAGAKWVHLDIMDGHFVPNLTFGAPVAACLKERCKAANCPVFFDAHLMVIRPMDYIGDFAKAGADSLTFHVESEGNPSEIIEKIKSFGMKAGISLKPKTPVSDIFPYLSSLDMVLVMSVEPGFSGQKFMEGSLDRIKELKAEIDRRGLNVLIQSDGGVDEKTVSPLAKAGTTVFVSGSYIFKNDYEKAVKTLISGASA